MTAHNEHTGVSMTTAGKGSLEKYAQGWEGIFGTKKPVPQADAIFGKKKTGDEACCGIGTEEPPRFACVCKCGQHTEVRGWNVEWNCINCGELCGVLTGGVR